ALAAADYFFIEPVDSISVGEWGGNSRLLQFAFEGFFISVLSGMRRRYLLLLHRRVEELRVTLRSIADAVVTTDARGVVDFLNPVAEGQTGWATAQAAGRPL